jgi:hypothetical protein
MPNRLLPALSAAVLLSATVVTTSAHADCDGTPLTATQMSTNFSDKTISFDCQTGCAGWMAGTSVDWNETHETDGDLVEIGTGASGVQPTDTVGSWETDDSTDPDRISYTYDGDSTYHYNVYLRGGDLGDADSTYEFCTAGTQTLKAIGTLK